MKDEIPPHFEKSHSCIVAYQKLQYSKRLKERCCFKDRLIGAECSG